MYLAVSYFFFATLDDAKASFLALFIRFAMYIMAPLLLGLGRCVRQADAVN